MAPPLAVLASTERQELTISTDNNHPTQTAVVALFTTQGQASTPSSPPSQPSQSFTDRILAAEHRFTSLTQNIAHFSPLKIQLDKHNVAIERIESEIKKKTVLLQSCQDKLKSIAKHPQNSRQTSNISLHASEDREADTLLAQQRAIKETLESLNGQLLAAKILHIGLTRQVTQYFESRNELQSLLEEIFSGSTPDHPKELALHRELEQICAEIIQVKNDFEKHRLAKHEFKEIRRYVDFWNDAVEKQIASNPKDATKPLKKFVPFFSPKPPSYTRIADVHMANARAFVPTLDDIGLLANIKMDTVADTSSELIIYTARFKDGHNALVQALENLHKRSRILKKKKSQCLEKLFDERCKIVSEELQAHYRSIGESLVGSSSSGVEDGPGGLGVTASSSNGAGGSAGMLPVHHRHHVESNVESYSSEESTLGYNSQELLLDAEELPSYFQHEYEATAGGASRHRRTFSLGSPARSSSASSSVSLHSPFPAPTTDSPPDYVRDEQGPGYYSAVAVARLSGSFASGTYEEEDPQFRAYRSRHDTHQRQNSESRSRANMDMPPGYDETRYQTAVNPV